MQASKDQWICPECQTANIKFLKVCSNKNCGADKPDQKKVDFSQILDEYGSIKKRNDAGQEENSDVVDAHTNIKGRISEMNKGLVTKKDPAPVITNPVRRVTLTDSIGSTSTAASDRAALVKAKEDLEKKLAEADKKIKALQEKVENLELASAEAKNSTQDSDSNNLKENDSQADERLKIAHAEINDLKFEVTELKSKESQLKSDLLLVESKKEQLEVELAEAKNKEPQIQKEFDVETHEKYIELQGEYDFLKTASQDKYAKLQKQLQQNSDVIERVFNKLTALKDDQLDLDSIAPVTYKVINEVLSELDEARPLS